jgi:hypothetical protein
MSHLVLDGTWEEVASHARSFAGTRVRLMVLSEELSPSPTGGETLPLLSAEERIRLLDAAAVQHAHLPAIPPSAWDRENLYEERW